MDNKVSIKERIGYAFGGLGQQLANKTVSQYLLVFFTNCLLLNPLTAGAIFMWGRVVDAITDIIMANISDKTKTKFGTYRPYILWGTIPLALTFVFAFFCPEFVRANGKTIVWAYIFYFLEASVFNTITGMNYGALASAVTTDPQERSKLGSARNIGESAATLIISAFFMSTVTKYGGQNEPKGWLVIGIVFAVLICAGYYICTFLVKEKIEVVSKKDIRPFSERIKVIKGNTPFWGIIVNMLLLNFIAVFGGTFFAYYCMYNLKHPEWISGLATIGGVAGIVAAFFFVVPLTKRIEKRQLMAMGYILYIIGSLLLIIFNSRTGAILFQLFTGVANSFCFSAIWAAVPDMCDYGAWKNGVSSPGLLYSICMFVLKVVVGFASYGVGAILNATGFDATAGLNQAEAVVKGINISMGIVPIILGVIAIAATFMMKAIDKKNMPTYRNKEQKPAEE